MKPTWVGGGRERGKSWCFHVTALIYLASRAQLTFIQPYINHLARTHLTFKMRSLWIRWDFIQRTCNKHKLQSSKECLLWGLPKKAKWQNEKTLDQELELASRRVKPPSFPLCPLFRHFHPPQGLVPPHVHTPATNTEPGTVMVFTFWKNTRREGFGQPRVESSFYH